MGKKVISFSLYGQLPDHMYGAIANARHASRAYPGWVCRFYVADDVPEGIIARLKDYGAEVISMGRRVNHEAMLWRFLAMVDPEVDIALSRDVDSRFTKCELLMVNEWLASGKKFHVMRWSLFHQPIMGGLWGVRGGIPNLKEPLEEYLRAAVATSRGVDQKFLRDNLYPQMKDNVSVYEPEFQAKRRYFVGETIHPFPPIAKEKRGRYLNIDGLPVGMRMPSRRSFVILSIYKNSPLSEYFLAQLLAALETWKLSYWFNIRFYVADNIRPDLVKRLRCFGRVILKSAKTTHKDDPKYWKLSILSEKNLEAALMVDFWQFFFLVRVSRGHLVFRELQQLSVGLKNQFRRIAPEFTSVSNVPITNINELVTQRDPTESYQEFINSTVYPRICTTKGALMERTYSTGPMKSWIRMLSPLWLYSVGGRIRVYLKS